MLWTITATLLALLPPVAQPPCRIFLLCYSKRPLNQGQKSPTIDRKARRWRALPELRQLISVSLGLHCCYLLPWRWDLGHCCCLKQWCCCWIASSGQCLRCMSSQEDRRMECSEKAPELGAGYPLDAGRRSGAAAACQSSPPEAGDGSSCEHCGTLSCKTSWSREGK